MSLLFKGIPSKLCPPCVNFWTRGYMVGILSFCRRFDFCCLFCLTLSDNVLSGRGRWRWRLLGRSYRYFLSGERATGIDVIIKRGPRFSVHHWPFLPFPSLARLFGSIFKLTVATRRTTNLPFLLSRVIGWKCWRKFKTIK